MLDSYCDLRIFIEVNCSQSAQLDLSDHYCLYSECTNGADVRIRIWSPNRYSTEASECVALIYFAKKIREDCNGIDVDTFFILSLKVQYQLTKY